MKNDSYITRREFVRDVLAAGMSVAAMGISAFPVSAAEQETNTRKPAGRIIKIKGDVSLNGASAAAGDQVFENDALKVGKKSQAWLLFDNTSVSQFNQLTSVNISRNAGPDGSGMKGLSLFLTAGSVLSQTKKLAKGEEYQFTVRTPVAVAAVRGTTFFTEIMAEDRTYICACYKQVVFTPVTAPDLQKVLDVDKHTAFFIDSKGDDEKTIFTKAGLIDHTDEEIEYLRKMLKRETGFDSEYAVIKDDSY